MPSSVIRQSTGFAAQPTAPKSAGLWRQKIWLPRFAYEMVPLAWFLVTVVSLFSTLRLETLSPWSVGALITGLFSLVMATRISWARFRFRRTARS